MPPRKKFSKTSITPLKIWYSLLYQNVILDRLCEARHRQAMTVAFPQEVQSRKNVHLATSDYLVIACYLWGVLHFSETLKAKHQLVQSLFPNFLEYSHFVRRCNARLPSIKVIRQALVFKEVEGMSVSITDSFSIPLCQSIRNFRSKVLGDYANVGYNATKG